MPPAILLLLLQYWELWPLMEQLNATIIKLIANNVTIVLIWLCVTFFLTYTLLLIFELGPQHLLLAKMCCGQYRNHINPNHLYGFCSTVKWKGQKAAEQKPETLKVTKVVEMKSLVSGTN